MISGQPVVLKWTRDTEGQTTLEIPPALMTAATSTPWGALFAGGASLVAAAVAANRQAAASAANKRADEHKADAAEGWAEALKP